MNKKRTDPGKPRGKSGPSRRPSGKPGSGRSNGPMRPRPKRAGATPFRIVERDVTPEEPQVEPEIGPFRVLIAVHRPRFRGRSERAAALVGWEVTALLNKQDAVGQVAKGSRPPDLFILSGDFGRQRDYAIFRAVQPWRKEGMKLIGLVEDCDTAPEGFPDSAPKRLCDICLEPPYKTTELRKLFSELYEKMRGEPAPPPLTAENAPEAEDPDED